MNPERSTRMTADQLVAYNLKRARLARGWTQEELAARLEPHLGSRLSRASLSWAETSATGGRRREFTATEILAFSVTFGLPVTWFFLPRHDPDKVPPPAVASGTGTLSIGVLLDLLFGQSVELRDRVEWLLHDIPETERTDLQDAAAGTAAFLIAAQLKAILMDVEGQIAGLEKLEGLLKTLPEHKTGVRRQIDLLSELRERAYDELTEKKQAHHRRMLDATEPKTQEKAAEEASNRRKRNTTKAKRKGESS